jgi:hypothetical protein
LEDVLKAIQTLTESLKNEIKELKVEMNQRFDRVEERLGRIEVSQTEDVIALLKKTVKQADQLEMDIEFLTGKVANHERIINRLNEN